MEYVYSLATDLGGDVDAAALHDEIDKLNFSATFFGLVVEGDDVTVQLSAALSSGEKADLDAAIAAHEPNWAKLRLYRYADEHDDHKRIDYKTGLDSRLHKRITDIFRGEVRQVLYWGDENEGADDLVLRVDCVYVRDGLGLAQQRTSTRTWYREDGSEHPDVKVTVKVYDAFHQMMEGRRRRTNVINVLTLDTLSMLVASTAADPMNPTPAEIMQAEADGRAFFETYSTQVSTYIATGDLGFRSPPAWPNVTEDTTPWLDNTVSVYGWTGPTIRDEILAALVEINAP